MGDAQVGAAALEELHRRGQPEPGGRAREQQRGDAGGPARDPEEVAVGGGGVHGHQGAGRARIRPSDTWELAADPPTAGEAAALGARGAERLFVTALEGRGPRRAEEARRVRSPDAVPGVPRGRARRRPGAAGGRSGGRRPPGRCRSTGRRRRSGPPGARSRSARRRAVGTAGGRPRGCPGRGRRGRGARGRAGDAVGVAPDAGVGGEVRRHDVRPAASTMTVTPSQSPSCRSRSRRVVAQEPPVVDRDARPARG